MRETRTTCGLYKDKLQNLLQELKQLESMLKERNKRDGVLVKLTDKFLRSNEAKDLINYQIVKIKELLGEGIVLLDKADRITGSIEELLLNLNTHFPGDAALSQILFLLKNMSEEPSDQFGFRESGDCNLSSLEFAGVDTALMVSVGAGVVVGAVAGVGLATVLAGIFGGIGAIGSLGAALAGGTIGAAFGAFVGLSISKFINEIKSGKVRRETYHSMLVSMVEFKSLVESWNGELGSIVQGAGEQIRQFQTPLDALMKSYDKYLHVRGQYRNSSHLCEEEIQQVMIVVSDCAQPIMNTFNIDKEHAWTIILYLKDCAE